MDDLSMAPQYIKFNLSQLGPYYADRLVLDAETNSSTLAGMAIANIKHTLKLKEKDIDQKVQYEAEQLGVSFRDRASQILKREPAPKTNDLSPPSAEQLLAMLESNQVPEAIELLKRLKSEG